MKLSISRNTMRRKLRSEAVEYQLSSLDAVCKDHDKTWLHDHILSHVNIFTRHHHHSLLAYTQIHN